MIAATHGMVASTELPELDRRIDIIPLKIRRSPSAISGVAGLACMLEIEDIRRVERELHTGKRRSIAENHRWTRVGISR